MATQKLMDELSDREAEAAARQTAATARVNEIERRVQDRIEELKRAQRARAQAEHERKIENERRIHDAEMKARQIVIEAEEARRVADRAREDAERQAEQAEISMKAAQRSLEALRPLAQKRIAIAEHGVDAAKKGAQIHVSLVDVEAIRRDKEFEGHAAASKADVEKKQADLQKLALEQVTLAEGRAASRARFRELCGLTQVRDHMLTSPEHYGGSDDAQALMMKTVGEWSKHPGRHWPWTEEPGPAIVSAHPHLDAQSGSDLYSSSMRYHPVCLNIPWLGSDDPQAQLGPSRQILTEAHIKTPLRPKKLPFGEHVSKYQGLGSFGANATKRKAPQSAR